MCRPGIRPHDGTKTVLRFLTTPRSPHLAHPNTIPTGTCCRNLAFDVRLLPGEPSSFVQRWLRAPRSGWRTPDDVRPNPPRPEPPTARRTTGTAPQSPHCVAANVRQYQTRRLPRTSWSNKCCRTALHNPDISRNFDALRHKRACLARNTLFQVALGSIASCKPSPITFTAHTVAKMNRPGTMASCGACQISS